MPEPDAAFDRSRFVDWLRRPEMLVGLSAVVLSLCGLFISIYEAGLMRTEQRASVWPHVETAPSIRADDIRLWVENTGIGPARVRAAALTHEGRTLSGWSELVEQLGVPDDGVDAYRSLIGGRVLAPGAPETIFRVTDDHGPAAPELIAALREAIVTGELEVAICYCSVYDECWMSHLQDVVRRSRGDAVAPDSREVESCEAAERSGI